MHSASLGITSKSTIEFACTGFHYMSSLSLSHSRSLTLALSLSLSHSRSLSSSFYIRILPILLHPSLPQILWRIYFRLGMLEMAHAEYGSIAIGERAIFYFRKAAVRLALARLEIACTQAIPSVACKQLFGWFVSRVDGVSDWVE